MNTIMFTRGPAFKQCEGREPFPGINSIHQLDIYPLLNNLLGIRPGKHDGNVTKVEYLLKDPDSLEAASSEQPKTTEIAFFLFLFIILNLY